MTNNGIPMTKNRTSWMPTNRTAFAVVSMTVIARASINLITDRATKFTMTSAPVTNETTSVVAVVPITVLDMMIMIAMMTTMYFIPTKYLVVAFNHRTRSK